MSNGLLIFLLNILAGELVTVLCEPDLSPSVANRSAVYVNQVVTVHCTTRGSQAMAWRSDEYIGSGQQLTFNSRSVPGATDASPNGAQATFVRMDNDNGELMLQSILSISVVSIYSSFTITCRNIDTGSTERVTYQTLSEPITSVIRVPFEVGIQGTCPNNNVIIECTARNSRNIQWGSSDNIGLSNIMARCSSRDESQAFNISGIGVISSTVQVSSSDRLVCRLTLPSEGLPVDAPLYIACTNLDFQVTANVSFEISGDCVSTTPISNPVTSDSVIATTDFVSEGTEMEDAASDSEVHVDLKRTVVPAVIGGISVLLAIIAVILGVFRLKKCRKTTETEKEDKGKKTEKEKKEEDMKNEKGLEIFIFPHSPTVSQSSGADLVMNEYISQDQ